MATPEQRISNLEDRVARLERSLQRRDEIDRKREEHRASEARTPDLQPSDARVADPLGR